MMTSTKRMRELKRATAPGRGSCERMQRATLTAVPPSEATTQMTSTGIGECYDTAMCVP